MLPRRQELPAQAFVSPSEATRAFDAGDRRVAVLSYGWLTRLHPDPGGERASILIKYLRSELGLAFQALFWDFGSMPQRDANGTDLEPEDATLLHRCFDHMAALYASRQTAVIRVTWMPPSHGRWQYNVRPIDERGWCVFEKYVAMIVVGIDGHGGLMTE